MVPPFFVVLLLPHNRLTLWHDLTPLLKFICFLISCGFQSTTTIPCRKCKQTTLIVSSSIIFLNYISFFYICQTELNGNFLLLIVIVVFLSLFYNLSIQSDALNKILWTSTVFSFSLKALSPIFSTPSSIITLSKVVSCVNALASIFFTLPGMIIFFSPLKLA